MNVDTAALRHFGVDGEPLDEGRLREFMKIPGIIVDSLDPRSTYRLRDVAHKKRGRGPRVLRQVPPHLRRDHKTGPRRDLPPLLVP